MPTPCPGCSKLCSLENGEPEVNDVEIGDGSITASVRLVRNSSCCDQEMKEYNYELNLDISKELKAHEDKYHNGVPQTYSVEEDSCDVDESGGNRYAKNMIGVTLSVDVTCDGEHDDDDADGLDTLKKNVGNYSLEDKTNAGSFDELN